MKVIAVPLGTVALLMLAACGGGSSDDDATATPSARASRTATATPRPAATTAPPTELPPTEAPATQAPAATQPTVNPPPPPPPPAPPVGNNAPYFPQALTTQEETNFEYDDDGLLIGAVTTLTILPATDPDGDPVSYAWSASTGSISGGGTSATWTRDLEFGDPASGTVVVIASDGRGGTAEFTIHFQ